MNYLAIVSGGIKPTTPLRTIWASSPPTRLKANIDRNSKSVVLSMDDHEEASDQFQGIKVVWSLVKDVHTTQSSFSLHPTTHEKSYYKFTFHRRHREIITESSLKYVVEEGLGDCFEKPAKEALH